MEDQVLTIPQEPVETNLRERTISFVHAILLLIVAYTYMCVLFAVFQDKSYPALLFIGNTALFVLTTARRPAQQLLRALPDARFRDNAEAAADAVRENARLAIEQTARRILDAHGFLTAQIETQTVVRDGEVHAGTFIISGVPAEQAQEIADEIFALTGERPVMETAPSEAAGR